MTVSPFRMAHARILVVDDSELILHLIRAALTNAGFRAIETAADGAEALEKTRLLRPELVILDVVMPRVDGLSYCEQARADAEMPRMPIIIQTAVDERETRLRALSCGADDFLNKPLDPQELVLRARVHLSRYFMLQDITEMCMYLKMEQEQTREMLRDMERAPMPSATIYKFNRHCEVLREVAAIPGVEER